MIAVGGALPYLVAPAVLIYSQVVGDASYFDPDLDFGFG